MPTGNPGKPRPNRIKLYCMRNHKRINLYTNRTCRTCAQLNSKIYRKKYPRKCKVYMKRYYKIYGYNYNKMKSAQEQNWKKVGLDIEYGVKEQLLIEQTFKCMICKEYPDCLDHCHKTLLVRGLLCNKCNQGLGRFKDSKKLLFKAIDYLGGR